MTVLDLTMRIVNSWVRTLWFTCAVFCFMFSRFMASHAVVSLDIRQPVLVLKLRQRKFEVSLAYVCHVSQSASCKCHRKKQ
jgi:hypothetical protein